jgi:hypothetical protein
VIEQQLGVTALHTHGCIKCVQLAVTAAAGDSFTVNSSSQCSSVHVEVLCYQAVRGKHEASHQQVVQRFHLATLS